jgi:hypothetical protein
MVVHKDQTGSYKHFRSFKIYKFNAVLVLNFQPLDLPHKSLSREVAAFICRPHKLLAQNVNIQGAHERGKSKSRPRSG